MSFFLKILIRLSHVNRTESRHALGESMTNLFLKRTHYDANDYHGKYFCRKQDKQSLVGRRRPRRDATPDSNLHFPRFTYCTYTILLSHGQLQDCHKIVWSA